MPSETTTRSERLSIFLAEDSEDDIFLVTRAIDVVGLADVRIVARRGEEALRLLRGCAAGSIDLLLLDINLPIRNGFEILVKVRESPVLAEVPVVMFSSSSRESDIRQAYLLGASAYAFKPSDYDELEVMLAAIIRFFTKMRDSRCRDLN